VLSHPVFGGALGEGRVNAWLQVVVPLPEAELHLKKTATLKIKSHNEKLHFKKSQRSKSKRAKKMLRKMSNEHQTHLEHIKDKA
jgi:hypothetical protein